MKGSFHCAPQTTDWITPKWIIDALGPFDLDPCASATQPWPTAERMIRLPTDGLLAPWMGRVWLNPPYDRQAVRWVRRLAQHGQGTALIFARTDTGMWHNYVFPEAHGILFLAGRPKFHYPDGRAARWSSGAPMCLVAYGEEDLNRLTFSDIEGELVTGRRIG